MNFCCDRDWLMGGFTLFIRPHLAAVVLVAGFTLGLGSLGFAQQADETAQPTAAQLFTQGIEAYEGGDLETARELFRRVDPMQLPREQRVRLYETLQELDRRSAPAPEAAPAPVDGEEAVEAAEEPVTGPSAAEMLSEADELAVTDPAGAAAIYEQVRVSADSGEMIQMAAEARLAQVQRRLNADLTVVRALLDQVPADLEAGNIDEARNKLDAVSSSGLELGWFDQQRLERGQALLREKQGQTVTAEVPVVEQPVAPAAPQVAAEAPIAPVPAAAEAPVVQAPADGVYVEEPAVVEPAPAPVAEAPAEVATPTVAPAAAQPDLLSGYRKLYAQQKAAEARDAAQRGETALAVSLYEQAAQLDPDNAEIREQLAAARAVRTQAASPAGVLEQTITSRQLRAQEAEAQFDQAMAEARTMMAAGDFAGAIQATAQARLVLDGGQRFLSTERYNQLRSQAEALTADILREQQRAEAEQVKKAEEARAQAEQKAEAEARRERDAELQRLLQRARDLQKDMKYDEALQILDQALFLDPNNIPAQAMRDMIQDVRIMVDARDLRRKLELEIAESSVRNLEAAIPYQGLVTYPENWPKLTQTRLAGLDVNGGESEVNRRVALELRDSVPINFEANRLDNVIDYLRNTTGVNFFVNWPVLEAAGIVQDAPITLQLANVPAEQAMRLVLQQASAVNEFEPAGFSIIEGVVTISTQRDLQRTTDTRVYDIRDLLVQVTNFTDAPEFDLNEVLSSAGGGSGGGGGGGGGSDLFKEDSDQAQVQATREDLIAEITTLIEDTVGRQEEWAKYGGEVSSLRELNGNLIVKTTPGNHVEISSLLAQLRETRAIQISVEARFLLVDQSFLEEIGMDLDFQINNPGGNFGPIRVAQDSIWVAQAAPGTNTPDNFVPATVDPNPGAFVPGFGFLPRMERSLDLNVAYLDDLEVNLLVKATQANQRSISLTAPRVTFFNGQRAYVTITRQVSFISDLEIVPDAAGFDPTVGVVNAGVILDVEGTISADRRYVTMTLKPSFSTLVQPIRQFELIGTSTIGTGDNAAVVTVSGFIELPELELITVASTVSVPDQGTLLMGGQRVVSETEVEAGVPVLSKIPVVSRFFTNTSTVKDERTLLILLKPTIIIQSEEEDALFPGLQQNPESYNIGRGTL
jgi:type II secretory pathway component GspD/PulD (secretin)/tetratricopeptide (TPR) repeat protein